MVAPRDEKLGNGKVTVESGHRNPFPIGVFTSHDLSQSFVVVRDPGRLSVASDYFL
jgi:hypothetical protein